ncbi:DUF6960 family protein [Aeoliella mucimassa]|uniref:Uncharacterized protein n=1 Tax=Aeoliella mucimassa TaxID=2527972 RepID=A0A518ASZ1_9BACT|nr:hypothetical protein [Aeoliella mucimassa]QDU57845.1 hypothetical protein Pan181_40680 [Aeoliella mucimassa]
MTLPLKTDPKYGYYPWWPENGNDWVHPEDVELARRVIPSPRIWRRDGMQGECVVLTYGKLTLRVHRTLWRELDWEGYNLGDMVEIRTRGMQNEHRTGIIREMHWDDHSGVIRYQVTEADETLDNPVNYTAADLKHVEPTDTRYEVRVEPPESDSGEYEVDTSE